MPINDQTTTGSQENLVHRTIRKTRQASNSSSLSLASESSLDDKPEWFANDTAVQFQKTPAEQDPAVGFFCKLVSMFSPKPQAAPGQGELTCASLLLQ